MHSSNEFIAQKLLGPDPAINSEKELFFHKTGNSGFDFVRGSYFVEAKERIIFDSYFNCFPLHLYDLSDEHRLEVRVKATGNGVLSVYQAHWEKSWDALLETRMEFDGEYTSVPIPLVGNAGVIFLEFIAIDPLEIYDIHFVIVGPKRQEVSISAAITTYKRDKEVQNTAKRLGNYFNENTDIAEQFDLIVVDNGGDTDSIPFSSGRVVKNPNYGGAGGFMRGLQEAIDDGKASHVLFMDDDASFFPENIRRTLAVLSFTKNPKLAISGAMLTELHKWMMWEDTATFNGGCRPVNKGRDLRKFMEVMACIFNKPIASPTRYGGWWYFCFPIEEAKTLTFPFFVRGDDIYFSLANDFQIASIPGVASLQEDFATKQSPLTLYLDMRNHIIQNLTFNPGKHSLKEDLKMIRNFFERYNLAYHYETAAAINLAIEDIMKGAEFWEENLDMADKRREISLLTQNEKVQTPLSYDPETVFGMRPIRKNRLMRLIRKLTRNGHLLPSFLLHKKGRILPLSERALADQLFRRPFAIHIDMNTGTGYRVDLDRRAFLSNRRTFRKLEKTFKRRHAELTYLYDTFKHERTDARTWRERLNMR